MTTALINEDYFIIERLDTANSPTTITHHFNDFEIIEDEFSIVEKPLDINNSLSSSYYDDFDFVIEQEMEINNIIIESDKLLEEDEKEKQKELDLCVERVNDGDKILYELENINKKKRLNDIVFMFFIISLSIVFEKYIFSFIKLLSFLLSIIIYILCLICSIKMIFSFVFISIILLILVYNYKLEKYIILFFLYIQEYREKNIFQKIFCMIYLFHSIIFNSIKNICSIVSKKIINII